jgi:hypothetical protein
MLPGGLRVEQSDSRVRNGVIAPVSSKGTDSARLRIYP